MSSPNDTTPLPPPLDLSGWRKLPAVLMAAGAVLSVIGAVMNPAEFGFSWLLAFMFFLSIALGALFLVMVHHLTDAGWSVATRRVCEHIASLLFPWLAHPVPAGRVFRETHLFVDDDWTRTATTR